MEELFGTSAITTKKGTTTAAEAFKDVKLVLVYFSMHNCPPCRAFTPLLADIYNEMNESEPTFEVVFCSGDKTQEQYNEYYAEMPWIALPKGDERVKTLAQMFQVKGVPRLIVMKPDGTVVNDDAVEKVKKEGPGSIEDFISA
mmetsp:Transcript_33001/g.24301  ORF Transcript_33001/g.24301 Transcript_33001/m.24301 type:complete len:143 (-) Transcript_33001:40-468(-)|eukprot:CAMPEP_0202958586 /NCGR_PEP_ID=MMETSP1396-20130829/2899_1 /ASSEMBLY_ACC=CAM_ASM_000872 /TAXON_ID= /ORGANISM="Pseudokeronopsis sp., Strain Brazil" /LENGTH=142 /DNA_ID=CAMNT_0049676737 /DNA_START=19 /DNA_END=447 /DNA_ORIENTATION=+